MSRRRRLLLALSLGLTLGWTGSEIKALVTTELAAQPRTELEQSVQAYESCMRFAGRANCRMTVEDFRIYHRQKRQLEALE